MSWAEFCMKFVPKNGIVLDPLIGTGTIAVAAKELGIDYIGIDLSEEYCRLARERLNS